jgi:multiple sugar transport system substrate-binding protein
VFDAALSPFLAGEITRDEAMQRIYDGWEEITEELGRDSQLEAYRDSLNITQ